MDKYKELIITKFKEVFSFVTDEKTKKRIVIFLIGIAFICFFEITFSKSLISTNSKLSSGVVDGQDLDEFVNTAEVALNGLADFFKVIVCGIANLIFTFGISIILRKVNIKDDILVTEKEMVFIRNSGIIFTAISYLIYLLCNSFSNLFLGLLFFIPGIIFMFLFYFVPIGKKII